MTAEPFSLNDLIASVQDSVGPDPHEIAAKVEPLIPESERHSVFLMLLARYIVNSKPRLTQVSAPRPESRSVPSKRSAPARSAKVAAYQAYGRLFRLTVKVGPSERKFMEDCTYEDLTYAALLRREHAARNEAAAAQYEALAELLRKHKVATVGKLPTKALDEFLARERSAA
jgi:hypothetical protein